jgi:hypothetical protein
MENSITKPRLYEATDTTGIICALLGSENTVCCQPQPITPEMPYYVAQANRILWERWEAAAIALFNLRSEETFGPIDVKANHRTIARICRTFPRIEELFPASLFEPEYDEMDYDCEPANRLEGVVL